MLLSLSISAIVRNPLNPRKHYEAAWLDEIAASLQSPTGQLERIKVRPTKKPGIFELVDGELRHRAAERAGIAELAAEVGEFTDAQVLRFALTSGTNRHELSPIDEAIGYRDLQRLENKSLREIGEELGRSAMHVLRLMALLDLPEFAQKAVATGKVSVGAAYVVARVPVAPLREKLAREVVSPAVGGGALTEKAAQSLVRASCERMSGATWALDDAALVPEAGACAACPYRTKVNTEVYGDVKEDLCMSPDCFARKRTAGRARLVARLEAAGKHALSEEENAAAYPKGEKELSWKSGFVVWAARVPEDLLKREVAENGKAPTWSALLDGAPSQPQIHVAFDQGGRAVDVVKLAEAMVAVPKGEAEIFKDEVRRRYGVEKGRPAAAEPRPAKRKDSGSESAASEPTPAPSPADDDLLTAAIRGLRDVLEACPEMPPQLRLRLQAIVRRAPAGC